MGMSPDSFYSLTPVEFIYAWVGWMEAQESDLKQQWELERWAVWVNTSIQLDRKDRLPMTQMFPLPWDAPTGRAEELTIEERRARTQNILKSIKYEADSNPVDGIDRDLVQPSSKNAAHAEDR